MNRLEHRIERGLRQIADRAAPSPDAWNAIRTRIADQGPDTETEIIMLTEADTDIPTPTRNRRWPLVAAAAIFALVIAGIALVNDNGDNDQSPPPTAVATVASPTTAAPTTAVATETVSFAVSSANDIPVTFTAPESWVVDDGWAVYSNLANYGVQVLFDTVSNIYTDGCQWTLLDPPVGPTVDDLVTAWANVPELAATAPVDITIDGYAGKQIEFTVPDYDLQCEGGKFAVYMLDGAVPPGQWAFFPHQHFQMLALDVDGTRLLIAASTYPDTPSQDRDALAQLLASIQIG
jgi:hypothetical protein